MKKIHRLLLKSFIGPLLFTFVIAMFVLLMQFLWKYIDDLVGKGLESIIIIKLLFYACASLVTMALPLAIMFASIMTFGNLGENNELLACKSAGMSLQRVMLPLVVLIIIITYNAYLFSNHVLPYSNLKMKTLLYSISHQEPEVQIKAGSFYSGIPGYTIKIEEKDSKTNLLKGLKIYDHTLERGNTKVTIADSGFIRITDDEKYISLTLYNGRSYEERTAPKHAMRDKSLPHMRDEFKSRAIRISLDQEFNIADENIFRRRSQMLNRSQLVSEIDTLEKEIDTLKMKLEERVTTETLLRNDKRKLNRVSRISDISVDTLDYDSIFTSMPLGVQRSIIKHAQNYARGNARFVTRTVSREEGRINKIRSYQVALHMKFVFPFACFIFFFIGAPLGAIIRKGGLGLPAVISTVFFILYYIISLSGEKFVKSGMLPPYLGMWLSSIILLPLGIFLTYKATTDSVILNAGTYTDFFRRIFRGRREQINNLVSMPLDQKFSHQLSGKANPTRELIHSNLEELNQACIDLLLEIKSTRPRYQSLLQFNTRYQEIYSLLMNNFEIFTEVKKKMQSLPLLYPSNYKTVFFRTRNFREGQVKYRGFLDSFFFYPFVFFTHRRKKIILTLLLEIILKRTTQIQSIIQKKFMNE